MRFRTKIFLGWAALTLCLLVGTFFATRRSVETSFNRMADETFVGINRGLRQLYLERVSSMRHACDLLVNIPELRALIAEQNNELSEKNQASLENRLDDVDDVVGATFLYALDRAGIPIAQNKGSPWSSPAELNRFLQGSLSARALVERTYRPESKGHYGLWVYGGRLYEVAAVPLVFQSESGRTPMRPEGALVMGKELTDAFSEELGKSYGCELSFLVEGGVAASSLAPPLRAELLKQHKQGNNSPARETRLGDISYRTAEEPLIDPCSGLNVGTLVVHQDQGNANNVLWAVLRSLVLTTVGGLLVAAIASFLMSLMITRPVHALVTGVREVAQGNLNVTFNAGGRDELAELARAFNDMVERLCRSREELHRLLDEARKGAQREHLLHEVAQQINQRLDVQSALTMFSTSVRDLFPDVELAVLVYDPEQGRFHALEHSAIDPEASRALPVETRCLTALQEPAQLERLAGHELIYLPEFAADSSNAGEKPPIDALTRDSVSVCIVPMHSEQRLLGAIVATRTRSDAFTSDERDFLQALADHFAIALANGQLYEELRRAYRDLRENQRQIIQSERLRAVGQMASGIAHDFNNHLTGVLAFLEMSLDRTDLDDELRSWLEMSRESSLSAASVVTLLRNFYRRDTSESLEPVDLNGLAAATISLTRPRWRDMPRQHGISIAVKEDFADAGCVVVNAAELRDALTNLLFNAVDAMPNGGDIIVRTRRIGEAIALEIQDSGTGMTDEVREKCLEPYFTTKGMQGTGLGLSMVHGIVERNRGRLEIDTQLGHGTIMRLVFPRGEIASASLAKPSAAGESCRRRVICVDDDLRILKALEGMLRQLGHDVTTTDSGAEVIRRIEAEPYDVLITDLGMPGMDGREVARRAKGLSPSTRVLLLTGWADRLQVEGEIPAGVDRLLGKPITKAQLQQALA